MIRLLSLSGVTPTEPIHDPESVLHMEMGDVAEIRTFLGRADWVSDVSVEDMYGGGKSRPRAKACSLFCYWATHELGITAIELARLLKLDQSSVSKAALRGEHLSREQGVTLEP